MTDQDAAQTELSCPEGFTVTVQHRRRGVLASVMIVLALVGASPTASQAPQPTDAEVLFRILVVGSSDQAEGLAARLAQGESFETLAREHSTDPSARQGGLVGPVALSALRPELRDTLRALGLGEVSDVLRLPTGFGFVSPVTPVTAAQAVGNERNAALAAAGAIKYNTFNVDGFMEASQAFRDFPKADGWAQDLRATCELRQRSYSTMTTNLSRLLDAAASGARTTYTTQEIAQTRIVVGQLYAYDGRMQEAIAQYEAAYRLIPASVRDERQVLEYTLGVAHLHKAEMDNGIYHEPGDRCLLAVRGGQALTRTEDFDRAVQYFVALLDERPDFLEAQWLLNAAFMATGGYPDRVPARYLVPPAAFESAEDIGRFHDVAAAAGVRSVASAGGVIVDDFDNDGVLDLMTSTTNSCGSLALLRRGADGTFTNQAEQFGLQDQLGGLNLVQGDYNNDGCRDVLVLRGGWDVPGRKSLLRNNCNGSFTDVTAASGLAVPPTSTQTAVWADIDLDGWTDLFVGNEQGPSQLFRNRRDGTFENIAKAAGVARSGFTKAIASADYNNDRYPDFYVTNLGGGNFLYRNNGNGTFTEVAAAAGVPGPDRGFPTWFFDYDNDGWEDLFVSSYYVSIDEIARSYVGRAPNAATMKLYRNAGDGTFRDVTVAAKLDKVLMPMGSNFGDVDNDGFLDMYLGTGSPSYASLFPSVLLRNRDGRSFVDVTASSGTGEMHKGHGVAFADLDHDGDVEIVFEVGGATPGDAHALRLFENPGHGNDWLGLRLVGVTTNRAALGARIRVTVKNAGVRRAIHRTVSSGGSFGASPLQQHIGLGKDARVVDVEVFWPASNTRQRYADMPKNQVLELREGSAGVTTIQRQPLPLGGPLAR